MAEGLKRFPKGGRVTQVMPLSPNFGQTYVRQARCTRSTQTDRFGRVVEALRKLLQAFYANAIPLDLLKAEQGRIGVAEQAARDELKTTEGDLDGWQVVLQTAIRLAGNCLHKGAAVGAPTLQRRCAPGRLHQGSQHRPGRVL